MNTAMRAASVIARPAKMNTNSAANSRPANRPGQKVRSRSQRGIRWYQPQASSRPVAITERTPDWYTSEIPCAANFAATCPMPQIRQSSTITDTAVASSGLRSASIPS